MWMQLGFLNASSIALWSYREVFVVTSSSTAPSPKRCSSANPSRADSCSEPRVIPTSKPFAPSTSAEANGAAKSTASAGTSPSTAWTPATRHLLPRNHSIRQRSSDADAVLFDEGSRPEFGPIPERFRNGERIVAEVNKRAVQVVGLTRIGVSFQTDGNLITSTANFQRIFSQSSPGRIDIGVLAVRRGLRCRCTARSSRILRNRTPCRHHRRIHLARDQLHAPPNSHHLRLHARHRRRLSGWIRHRLSDPLHRRQQ